MDKKQILANEPSGEGLVKGILHLETRMNKGRWRGEGENQEKMWICNMRRECDKIYYTMYYAWALCWNKRNRLFYSVNTQRLRVVFL